MRRPDPITTTALVAGALAASVLTALPAWAHPGHGTNGLGAGLAHPVSGVDHLLAMVVVGVLATVLARPFAVPAAFLSTMAAGGALGLAGVHLPGVELTIALSVALLGGALVAGRSVRPQLALGLVAVAGLVHGHAHGTELPAGGRAVSYVVGFLAVTAALHVTGVLGGLAVRDRVRTRAALGAAVVGAGVGLLAAAI